MTPSVSLTTSLVHAEKDAIPQGVLDHFERVKGITLEPDSVDPTTVFSEVYTFTLYAPNGKVLERQTLTPEKTLENFKQNMKEVSNSTYSNKVLGYSYKDKKHVAIAEAVEIFENGGAKITLKTRIEAQLVVEDGVFKAKDVKSTILSYTKE